MSTIDKRKFYYIYEYFKRKGIVVSCEYDSERKEYIYTFQEKIDDHLYDLFKFYSSWVYVPRESTLFIGL